VEVVDSESFPPTVRYVRPDGTSVTLLARGFPLNFDGSPEVVLHEDIQLTRALMLIAALQATKTKAAGVHRLDVESQQWVLKLFEDVRDIDPDGPVAEAIALARAELAALAKNPRDLKHDLRHQRRT
jgi:hypothetical protein